MATSSLRLLAGLLLASTFALAACDSSVSGGGDDGGSDDGGSDDGGSDDGGTGDGDDGATCAQELWLECPNEAAAVCEDGEWSCPGCPEAMPQGGDACDAAMTCSWADTPLCGEAGEITFTCDGSTWSEPVLDRCSPPQCPIDPPTAGDACSFEGQTCEYASEMDCGPGTLTYGCVDGAWEDQTMVDRCALPACSDLTDATQCAEFGCRWLVPGCDDNAIPAEGCYDPEPCDPAIGCPYGDQVCQQASYDPCAGSNCDACGAQEMLCVPAADGGAE